ncbi:hypothetical protein FPSE_06600 [Fusarium pseudograminearum CS3096]|uniref:Shikimate dehydrogenase substrate binding N-terminal domain-containing protein n=1 Tax=Fusarium pseudograminearum (strain CS3096) TaxID=1028729 RepID=K3UM17_FUSPC|nr:hypothetical protein FPSE_06600 [Fusarium pseudograminearum CS3096]EKJ73176.1 hypothetical protein FPSE_06600 [Fusarium pseudograminearum CS3096]KAF0640683.1 hypothetical protein FPSE5266_06600 [Fusarium pseudograminearum]
MVANDNSLPLCQRHEDSQVSTTKDMRYTSVNKAQAVEKRQFFIFGHNISHSLSPTLHNAGFQELGLPHHYQIHETENVDQSVERIINSPDFGGASVTFPHKLQISKLLHSVSEQGNNIDAINTVVVKEKDGQRLLHGDNTDWIGIRRCILKSGSQDFTSSSALVLGAGGAARAACYAIKTLGFRELIVVNRTLSKAEELASKFSELKTRAVTSLEEAEKTGNADIGLIVACIPADDLGEDKVPSGLFSKSRQGVLVEMAYRPQVTGMMTVAQRNPGWKVYRGVDVLEEQAYAQFELWTGKQAPIKAMRSAMQVRVASA